MNDEPIFRGRTAAGEVLYDVLGWPRRPCVYAIGLGGLEVGCTLAYLGRGTVGTVVGPPGTGPGKPEGPVMLVDDGCTPPAQLLAAVEELLAAGVSGLVLASPWLVPGVREGARALKVPTVALLSGSSLPRPLYPSDDPPCVKRVARFLEAPAVLPAWQRAAEPSARRVEAR